MADSTLNAIRIKVRRLTRSPSEAQITNAQIDEYINTFVQYDFPEHLRLFNLRETHTFYTTPYVDTYASNTILTSPLEDFVQRYLTVHDPIFVDGYQVTLSQNRNEFFSWWPQNRFVQRVGTGDGVTLAFTGTLSQIPVLRNFVNFTSIDNFNNGLVLKDIPFNSSFGNLVVPDQPDPGLLDPFNNINYVTGVFTLTFPSAPGQNQLIESRTLPFQPSRPTSVLFFDGEFIVRPVPDKVYPVQFEVYRRPTELLAINQSPELQEWWQYISASAAKKIFEDRSDYDSVEQIMPLVKEQEVLILRRTIVQQTKERTATIYTDSLQGVNASYNWGQGGF